MAECSCDKNPPVFAVPAEDALARRAGFLAGNHLYQDLRDRFDSAAVSLILETDRGLVRRLREWNEPTSVKRTIMWYLAECAGLTMEQFECDLFESSPFSYLDPGVASAVVSLAVYGAIPTTSCNGGVFGDPHFHPLPLVAFHAAPEHGQVISRIAKRVGMHMEQSEALNCPMMWHTEVDPFLEFAELLRVEEAA
jgi:hypothetical protein